MDSLSVEILIGIWVLVALFCEFVLISRIKYADGKSSWPDDDSKAMAKKYADDDNEICDIKKRKIRIFYLVIPPVVGFVLFVGMP